MHFALQIVNHWPRSTVFLLPLAHGLFEIAFKSAGETQLDNTVHITLMRHGRSRADDEMVHEGRYDSPLTDAGRAQVRLRAEGWKRSAITFDLTVASTLVRASESAQIVGEVLDVPVEYDPDWMELDNGPLAGLPFDVAKERYPKPDFANPFQPYVATTGEGESSWDLLRRAAGALQSVVRRGQGSFLVVAHGGILNAAMYCMLGAFPPPHGSGVHFAFGDAAFVHTSYSPGQHRWTIREMSLQTPVYDENGGL